MDYDQYQSIIDYFDLSAKFFIWQIGSGTDRDMEDKLEDFTVEFIHNELYGNKNIECILALMQYNYIDYDEADNLINNKCEYFVGDAEAADAEALVLAEYYYEDIIQQEIPTHLQFYFDKQKWLDDYLMDGPASIIATYDGDEHTEVVNNTTYYIYHK